MSKVGKHSLDPGPVIDPIDIPIKPKFVLGLLLAGLIAFPCLAGTNDGPDPYARIDYAPSLDVTPHLARQVAVPMPWAPVEPDRRCSDALGETQACRVHCASEGGFKFPPIRWVASGPGMTLYSGVASCEVRTVGGILTLLCECSNARNET